MQSLQQQFPYVDANTINNVVNNDCNGNVSTALPILQRINQFNQSMNVSPVNPEQAALNTAGGEGTGTAPVVIQQPVNVQMVPLQIVQQPVMVQNYNNLEAIKLRYPSWNLYLGPSSNSCHRSCDAINCPCCAECCTQCYLIPDSYSNGLYQFDLHFKNLSFVVFFAMSIYSEFTMYMLKSAGDGINYIPAIGLIFIGLGSVLFYLSKGARHPQLINKVIALCYAFGGFLYFVGYIMYTVMLKSLNVCDIDGGTVCDCDYYYSYYYSSYTECICQDGSYGRDECSSSWWSWDNTIEGYVFDIFPPYWLGRGLFIAYHCALMAVHFFNVVPKCMRNRLGLIQVDSFMFALYLGLVCGFVIPEWTWALAFSGLCHFWAMIISFVNMCIAQPYSSQGGCNAFSVTGILMIIFYMVEIVCLVTFTLVCAIHDGYEIQPNIVGMDWWCWQIALIVFGTVQFWILLRAQHPAFVACCSNIQRDLVKSEVEI